MLFVRADLLVKEKPFMQQVFCLFLCKKYTEKESEK